MKHTLYSLVALVLLASQAQPARATSIFVEGRCTAVATDGRTFTVKGYDYYNPKTYGEKITDVPVKVAADGIFVLDGRVVKREVALVPGRWMYCIGSSAGSSITLVLSEPASRQHGQVVSADGDKLKLKVVQGKDACEVDVAIEAGAIYRDGGKPAAREAVLAAGKSVRVAPARPQSILAYSPENVIGDTPKGFHIAAAGVLKDPATQKLAVLKGDAVSECAPEGKGAKTVIDIAGDVHAAPSPKFSPNAGDPAVLLCWLKRGSNKNWYVVLPWPDETRAEGIVKSVAAKKVTLGVLSLDGVKEKTVELEDGAVTKLDNKPAAPEAALKVGNHVSIYGKRPQVIENVQWGGGGS